MSISSWSTTASANVSINGVNIAEGCPAGNVNNALREIMADVKSWTNAPTFSTLTGPVTVTGDFTVSGRLFAKSPGTGSSGAVTVQDATGNPDAAYIQFVNTNNTTQYSWVKGRADGKTEFSGAIVPGAPLDLAYGGTGGSYANVAALLAGIGGVGIASSSLGTNGYIKLTNGLIIQWVQVGCTAGSAASFTWPITFPSAVFVAVPGGFSGLSFSGSYSAYLQGVTTVGGSAYGNNGASASSTVAIIAIGN